MKARHLNYLFIIVIAVILWWLWPSKPEALPAPVRPSSADSLRVVDSMANQIEAWKERVLILQGEKDQIKPRVLREPGKRDTIREQLGYTREADSLIIESYKRETAGLWDMHRLDSSIIVTQDSGLSQYEVIVGVLTNTVLDQDTVINYQDQEIAAGKHKIGRLKVIGAVGWAAAVYAWLRGL